MVLTLIGIHQSGAVAIMGSTIYRDHARLAHQVPPGMETHALEEEEEMETHQDLVYSAHLESTVCCSVPTTPTLCSIVQPDSVYALATPIG